MGKVDTYGLELALGLATSRLAWILPDVNLAYTYLQTEIKSGIVTSATMAGNVAVDLSGNELPYAPPHTLTVGLVKQTKQGLRLRADVRFVDEVFTDFENIERTFNRGDTWPDPQLLHRQCQRRLQIVRALERFCGGQEYTRRDLHWV